MQIDFKALEQALAPIEQIGQGELTFDVGSTTLTLRVLVPTEEVEAQKYAAGALSENERENTAVDYLDRFRVGCLSHAVVAVGDQDFRNVEFIETGEVLDNGVKVKIARHMAMRKLLLRWTRSALTGVFIKFNELLKRAEMEAEKAIEFEPADITTERERLQKRLEELAEKEEQATAADKSKFAETVETLAQSDAQLEREPLEDPDEPEFHPEQVMPVSKRRAGPITPQQAPPPAQRPVRAPQPASAQAPLHRADPPQADSSLMNTDDDDAMNAALDAEHNRLLAMRRRAQQGVPQPNEGSLLAATGGRRPVQRPPHWDAAAADVELGTLDTPVPASREAGAQTVYPTFTEDLGTRAPAAPAPVINPEQAGATTNPRFKPRQKS